MLSSKEICRLFGTLEEYKLFRYEWDKTCYELFPTQKNKERLKYSEKVLAQTQAELQKNNNE